MSDIVVDCFLTDKQIRERVGVLFMTYLWTMKITKESAEKGRDEGDIRRMSVSCHRHHRITSIYKRMKERWKEGKKKKKKKKTKNNNVSICFTELRLLDWVFAKFSDYPSSSFSMEFYTIPPKNKFKKKNKLTVPSSRLCIFIGGGWQ